MIGLIITLAIIAASIVGGLTLIAVVMYSTGRLSASSPQGEVQRAKVRAQIAQYERDRAEAEELAAEANKRAAHHHIQRQMLEAKSVDDLAKIHDLQFQKEIEKPRRVEGEVIFTDHLK